MTYSSSSPQRLDTLQHLHTQAEQASQNVGVQVGQQQEQLRAAQTKLDQLVDYGNQYRGKLQQMTTQGSAWGQVREMREFIDRVDAAITAQRQEIARQKNQLGELMQQLQAARQREKAFEVLIDQHVAQNRQTQKRHMLKDLQEWAVRRVSQFLPSSQQRSDL